MNIENNTRFKNRITCINNFILTIERVSYLFGYFKSVSLKLYITVLWCVLLSESAQNQFFLNFITLLNSNFI